MARAGAATVSAAAKQVSSRSSSVANPHAQTEPSNLRRSMPPGATASAIKRRCFPDLLRNPRNHRHSALPSKQLEFAPNECVDRNYITAGLKPKQVSIVGVGWPCEGRCRFANPEAPTDDQAAANLAQTARPTFMTAAMSEMGQSLPNWGVCVASVHPSTSDIVLRPRNRRNGPGRDIGPIPWAQRQSAPKKLPSPQRPQPVVDNHPWL